MTATITFIHGININVSRVYRMIKNLYIEFSDHKHFLKALLPNVKMRFLLFLSIKYGSFIMKTNAFLRGKPTTLFEDFISESNLKMKGAFRRIQDLLFRIHR